MGKSAPSPDTSAIAAAQASTAQADLSYQLGNQQLQWAQQQFNAEQPYVNAVTASELKSAQQAQDFASQQQKLYRGVYAPLSKKFANQAQTWASPAEQVVNAGSAESLAAASGAAGLNQAQQQEESYGINPGSGRFYGTNVGARTQTGAAEAGAGTTAIQQTKLQGLGLEQSAIQTGEGIPSSTAGLTNSASSAGGTGAAASQSNLSTGASTQATSNEFTNAGSNAMNVNVNAVNGYNSALMQGYAASMAGYAGLGSALGGLLGGSSISIAEGGPIPTNPQGVDPSIAPGGGMKFADGGGIPMGPQGRSMGSPGSAPGATPGGAIPDGASPSGGVQTDDVPARLTAGEFVMPKDVTGWLGQKHMYNLIDKARQEAQQAHARPDVGAKMSPPLTQRPSFVSRPANMGIPMAA